MAEALLKTLLRALAAAAVIIGAMIFLGGPAFTAGVFSGLLSAVTGYAPAIGLAGPDIDSELRFYAVFWIAYGVVLFRAARDLAANRRLLLVLLGLFFAGGVGRLLSIAATGRPDLLFEVLMGVELGLPVALAALLWRR